MLALSVHDRDDKEGPPTQGPWEREAVLEMYNRQADSNHYLHLLVIALL